MILSMKPPYEVTTKMLFLITSISEKLGAVNANFLNKPSPQLRKLAISVRPCHPFRSNSATLKDAAIIQIF